MRLVALSLIVLALAGCGGNGGGAATMAASSGQSLKASMSRMASGMKADQKKQFVADCVALTMPALITTIAVARTRASSSGSTPDVL